MELNVFQTVRFRTLFRKLEHTRSLVCSNYPSTIGDFPGGSYGRLSDSGGYVQNPMTRLEFDHRYQTLADWLKG